MAQSNGGVATTSRLTLYPMLNANTGIVGFYAFDPTTGFNDITAPSTHSYKVEEVIAGRTPTVSRIIIGYRDLGPVAIICTLSGTNDSQQVVQPVTQPVTLGNQVPTGKLMTKILGMQLTAQNLQFTIFRPAGAGPLSITKVVLCGRVENSELA
jgi:hypothetical protein